MLSGLVVNAGIYLISMYKNFRRQQEKTSPIQAYIKAFNHKITPIALTLISTILGLLPFLSDGPDDVFWFDFAVATIAGLCFSVIALLLYLPLFVIKRRY